MCVIPTTMIFSQAASALGMRDLEMFSRLQDTDSEDLKKEVNTR